MAADRLDKILCGTGHFSRSEARTLILSGVVTVDGRTVRKPEEKAERTSAITVRGERIDPALYVYYMMNKPRDYVSATRDEHYPAVTGLLPPFLQRRGLFPVGRLDADVTGLLLLTDDGAYAHRITSPRRQVKKVYEVHTDGPLLPEHRALLQNGVTLSDGTSYRPAELSVFGEDPTAGLVTVTEGKYHEVKNLLAACGRRVLSMKRRSIGALRLDEELPEGAFRQLTEEEAEFALLP